MCEGQRVFRGQAWVRRGSKLNYGDLLGSGLLLASLLQRYRFLIALSPFPQTGCSGSGWEGLTEWVS